MRILITTSHLRNFAGSEMVTYELIEYFLEQDWIVDVYTHDLGEPMLSEVQKLPSEGRLTLLVADLSAEFDHDYDLVWVQHSILPEGMLRRLETAGVSAPMVWHHMSSFLDVELPRHASIERQLAAVSMGMSSATVESLRRFGLEPDRLVVFDNPAPDAFADHVRSVGTSLRSLLVVSNHVPAEVRAAAGLLEQHNVKVSFLGADDGPVRITPYVLAPFDAILTIGKTVQYSLSMGIPVYVYDHFGGPGWLGADNFAPTAHDSFSGRRDRRQIAASEIVQEVLSGFEDALDFATRERASLSDRWRLSRRIRELLEDERLVNSPRLFLSPGDARQLSSLVAQQRDLYRLIWQLQSDLSVAHQTIDHMARSRSWKFTRPARWLRSLISRRRRA